MQIAEAVDTEGDFIHVSNDLLCNAGILQCQAVGGCAYFQSQLHQTQCNGFPIRPLKWFSSQEGNHDGTMLTKLEVAQYFRESKERLGRDCYSRSVNIPAETAIQTTEGAMGINANHDNEGFFAVSGCDYQRYRPAILRTEPAVYPGFCERALKVASSELRAVTTTEMG